MFMLFCSIVSWYLCCKMRQGYRYVFKYESKRSRFTFLLEIPEYEFITERKWSTPLVLILD